MTSTALLDFEDLPLFDQISPDQVLPGITELIKQAKTALNTVTAPEFAPSWNDIASVLDVSTERLSRAWSAVNHLSSVADNPELRSAYNETLPVVTDFWTQLGSSELLFEKYKSIDPASLNPVQREAHKKALKGFVLSGAELKGAAKDRFAHIQSRLSELSQKFSENVLDATDKWSYIAGEQEMIGVKKEIEKFVHPLLNIFSKVVYKNRDLNVP